MSAYSAHSGSVQHGWPLYDKVTYVYSLKRIDTALKAPALATATNGTVYSHT